MSPAALRFGMVIEFLVAIIAVFFLWSQIAGQDLLDVMPWHWKLLLGAGISFAITQATACAVRDENPWNARTMGWLVTVVVLAILIGVFSYYVQSQEPAEEEEPATIGSIGHVL